VQELLGVEADLFCAYYDITAKGNLPAGEAGWEEKKHFKSKKTSR